MSIQNLKLSFGNSKTASTESKLDEYKKLQEQANREKHLSPGQKLRLKTLKKELQASNVIDANGNVIDQDRNISTFKKIRQNNDKNSIFSNFYHNN